MSPLEVSLLAGSFFLLSFIFWSPSLPKRTSKRYFLWIFPFLKTEREIEKKEVERRRKTIYLNIGFQDVAGNGERGRGEREEDVCLFYLTRYDRIELPCLFFAFTTLDFTALGARVKTLMTDGNSYGGYLNSGLDIDKT